MGLLGQKIKAVLGWGCRSLMGWALVPRSKAWGIQSEAEGFRSKGWTGELTVLNPKLGQKTLAELL